MELYQQMYYILFHGISDALEALDEARIQDARQLLRAAQQKAKASVPQTAERTPFIVSLTCRSRP